MAEIYLVVGETGEYDAYRKHVVCAFLEKPAAEDFCRQIAEAEALRHAVLVDGKGVYVVFGDDHVAAQWGAAGWAREIAEKAAMRAHFEAHPLADPQWFGEREATNGEYRGGDHYEYSVEAVPMNAPAAAPMDIFVETPKRPLNAFEQAGYEYSEKRRAEQAERDAQDAAWKAYYEAHPNAAITTSMPRQHVAA